MKMEARGSWHAWTERDWRDEVADRDEDLGRFDQDLDSFIADMKDIARMVVDVTVEPLRAFAESFPRAMAYESKHWHRAWRGTPGSAHPSDRCRASR
jgi:hypothetical protein